MKLGLSGALARWVILKAQRTRYKGGVGYRGDMNKPAGPQFPQAATESADFESYFRFFPDYLVKETLRDLDILDFGSGYGGRTVEYKLCGAKRVCGVEPFGNVIELSRQYARSRGIDVEFRTCGHTTIPYPDNSFDVVISYDVLEHVQDPRLSLQEIRRVLRPGGLSFNVFPVYFGAKAHHLDYMVAVPGLHWFFSARTLVNAVNSVLEERPDFGIARQPRPKRSFDGAREVLPGLNGLSGWHLNEVIEGFECIRMERHHLNWWDPDSRFSSAIAQSRLPTIVRDVATSSISLVLRKPGSNPVPLRVAPRLAINSLATADWQFVEPARHWQGSIVIRGTMRHPTGYAAVSPPMELGKAVRLGIAGQVKRGGISLGLLDARDQWAANTVIGRGLFREWVEVPDQGTYRVVISSNLGPRQRRNDVVVHEIGYAEFLEPTSL
jgi:SAM-dependent methyltransferase